MKELQAPLVQVRSDAAECLLLATLATGKKSEMFVKMAEHLNGLALEIEKTIAANGPSATIAALHPEASVSVPAEEDRDGATAPYVAASVHEGTVPDYVAVPPGETKRSSRIFAWLLAIIAGVGAASFLWASGHLDRASKQIEWFLSSDRSTVPRDDVKQEITALLSSERSERAALTEGLRALAARIDHVEAELENLKKTPPPSNSVSGEEVKRPLDARSSPSAQDEPPSPRDGDQTFTVQAPTKPPDIHSPTGSVARVGTSAEPDGLRRSGPAGCEHFRSYDAASATYVTLDGRRRACR